MDSKAILLISNTQGWVRLILLDNPLESAEALSPRTFSKSFVMFLLQSFDLSLVLFLIHVLNHLANIITPVSFSSNIKNPLAHNFMSLWCIDHYSFTVILPNCITFINRCVCVYIGIYIFIKQKWLSLQQTYKNLLFKVL